MSFAVIVAVNVKLAT